MIKKFTTTSVLKRYSDAVISLCALITLSPLVVLISFMVFIVMGRPIFFRQERAGLFSKPFMLLKFRTMLNTSDEDALADDLRLTKLGIWLRNWSLDELPQFWNVLKGDMSLVGPRPLLTEYVPRYSSFQLRRHQVRPGLTGWAQINGRNSIPWETKLRYDVWYVKNKSVCLDLHILLKTISVVIWRRGINEAGNASCSPFNGTLKREK